MGKSLDGWCHHQYWPWLSLAKEMQRMAWNDLELGEVKDWPLEELIM